MITDVPMVALRPLVVEANLPSPIAAVIESVLEPVRTSGKRGWDPPDHDFEDGPVVEILPRPVNQLSNHDVKDAIRTRPMSMMTSLAAPWGERWARAAGIGRRYWRGAQGEWVAGCPSMGLSTQPARASR